MGGRRRGLRRNGRGSRCTAHRSSSNDRSAKLRWRGTRGWLQLLQRRRRPKRCGDGRRPGTARRFGRRRGRANCDAVLYGVNRVAPRRLLAGGPAAAMAAKSGLVRTQESVPGLKQLTAGAELSDPVVSQRPAPAGAEVVAGSSRTMRWSPMPAPRRWRSDRNIASDPPGFAQPGNNSGLLLLQGEREDPPIIPGGNKRPRSSRGC